MNNNNEKRTPRQIIDNYNSKPFDRANKTLWDENEIIRYLNGKDDPMTKAFVLSYQASKLYKELTPNEQAEVASIISDPTKRRYKKIEKKDGIILVAMLLMLITIILTSCNQDPSIKLNPDAGEVTVQIEPSPAAEAPQTPIAPLTNEPTEPVTNTVPISDTTGTNNTTLEATDVDVDEISENKIYRAIEQKFDLEAETLNHEVTPISLVEVNGVPVAITPTADGLGFYVSSTEPKIGQLFLITATNWSLQNDTDLVFYTGELDDGALPVATVEVRENEFNLTPTPTASEIRYSQVIAYLLEAEIIENESQISKIENHEDFYKITTDEGVQIFEHRILEDGEQAVQLSPSEMADSFSLTELLNIFDQTYLSDTLLNLHEINIESLSRLESGSGLTLFGLPGEISTALFQLDESGLAIVYGSNGFINPNGETINTPFYLFKPNTDKNRMLALGGETPEEVIQQSQRYTEVFLNLLALNQPASFYTQAIQQRLTSDQLKIMSIEDKEALVKQMVQELMDKLNTDEQLRFGMYPDMRAPSNVVLTINDERQRANVTRYNQNVDVFELTLTTDLTDLAPDATLPGGPLVAALRSENSSGRCIILNPDYCQPPLPQRGLGGEYVNDDLSFVLETISAGMTAQQVADMLNTGAPNHWDVRSISTLPWLSNSGDPQQPFNLTPFTDLFTDLRPVSSK